jgi:hypothetical protein
MSELNTRAAELVARAKIKSLWTEWTSGIITSADARQRVKEMKNSPQGIPDAVRAEFDELDRAVSSAV